MHNEIKLKPGSIGGVNYFSTVDWPGKIVSTIFFRGCPWHCDYCHNADLIDSRFDESQGDISWNAVYSELKRRVDFIDGVVLSGGEPLFQSSLREIIESCTGLGIPIGLHTNGVNPSRLGGLISYANPDKQKKINWIGIDIKAPRDLYPLVTHSSASGTQAFESLDLVINSKIPFEVRTTLEPEVFDSPAVLYSLAGELSQIGINEWVLQRCRKNDDTHRIKPLSFNLEDFVSESLSELFQSVVIR